MIIIFVNFHCIVFILLYIILIYLSLLEATQLLCLYLYLAYSILLGLSMESCHLTLEIHMMKEYNFLSSAISSFSTILVILFISFSVSQPYLVTTMIIFFVIHSELVELSDRELQLESSYFYLSLLF